MGAYYTDSHVAEFLTWWAVRAADDRVMDPSFGGGVFLRAAASRIAGLGGRPGHGIVGVEIDEAVHRRGTVELGAEWGLPGDALILGDFFDVEPIGGCFCDAVVGNPPFIRYQRFRGEARRRALDRCRSWGVSLPELCSSWAPFVVHSVAMLRPGGRLAMVLPMEAAHAKYARPVLEHLRDSFELVTILTFREKLFPALNEDAILLLAEGKGRSCQRFLLRDIAHAGLLDGLIAAGRRTLAGTRPVEAAEIVSGRSRLIAHLIPRKARELCGELRDSGRARPLGALADVGIGYVSGANEFFHMPPERARQLGLPDGSLKPVVCRGRALSGLRFTTDDWREVVARGDAAMLLHVAKSSRPAGAVLDYVRLGESRGVHLAYKCRSRSPWYCVPNVYRPDAFLTYMSGSMPRLVANDAGAFAPNTLHVVRMRPMAGVGGPAATALWQTSLVRLSVEIEGHALGGGMLKLEPTEAESVLVPAPDRSVAGRLEGLADELDAISRRHGDDAARARADRVILIGELGLSAADCDLLAAAANKLRARRGYGEALDGVA